MKKEIISDKQYISSMLLFITGASLVFGTAAQAKKDLWFAIIIGILMSFFAILFYIKILDLFPNKDLFDILQCAFGTVIGNGICLLYVYYSIHTAGIILFDFKAVLGMVGLQETPEVVILSIFIFLIVWIVKEGIETLGRWAEFFVLIIIILIFTSLLLQISSMKFNNLLPFLHEGIKPVLKGAYSAFTFPFAEVFIFTAFAGSLKNSKSNLKVYLLSLFIGGILIFSISTGELLVLGSETLLRSYFPAYMAISRVNINIIQRIEVIVSASFLITGFFKMSIYLLVACKGISKVFKCNDYRFVVMPLSLFVMIIGFIHADSTMAHWEWGSEIWPYFAFPFLIFFPFLTFILAKIRCLRQNNK